MMPAFSAMAELSADTSLDLLVKAQAGDDGALDRLLGRYLPRLQRWASGRLPSAMRTMLDTGDLVQDAIINALKHIDTLEIRTEGALQAYLRRAVNNRIVDLYRRSGRRPVRGELPENARAVEPSPLEAAIGAEALANYEDALNRLKDDDRQAIVLRVELGLDYDEVAAQLGKPSIAAARMAVTRAIARLAQEMRRGT
jgi:RNA polymerase sigma-70 factor (ECF subfamily)